MQRPIRLQKPGPQWSFGTKRSIVGGTTSGHAPLTRNSSLNPSLYSRPEPLQVSQRSCYCTCICLSQDFLFSILKKKSHLQIMPKMWHCFNKRIQILLQTQKPPVTRTQSAPLRAQHSNHFSLNVTGKEYKVNVTYF